MTAPAAPAPGFYADPLDPAGERWWDGSAWTETVRSAGSVEELDLIDDELDDNVLLEDELLEDELLDDELDEDDPGFVPRLAPDPLPAATGRVLAAPAAATPEPSGADTAELGPDQPAPAEPVPDQLEANADSATPAEPSAAPTIPAGLYPDPYGQAPLRWWDGVQWTIRTADAAAPQEGPVAGGGSVQAGASAPADGSLQPSDAVRPPTRADVLPPPRRTGGAWARPTPSVRRPSARILAAAAILLVGLGARVYFLLDDDSAPAPAQIAQSINLRSGDLPAGWVPQPDAAADPDSAERALSASSDLGSALARCLGAPDPGTSELYSATSPTFTSGAAEVSSDVTVVKDAATAAADLRAMRGPKVAGCVSTVANPALKKDLAARGMALTGFTLTRLPDAPADGYAMRMTWTLTAKGRSLPLHTDVYGFVRGAVEVELSSTKAGATPDPKLGRQLVRQLQSRAADVD